MVMVQVSFTYWLQYAMRHCAGWLKWAGLKKIWVSRVQSKQVLLGNRQSLSSSGPFLLLLKFFGWIFHG